MRRLSALLSVPLLVGACSPAEDEPVVFSAPPLSVINAGSIASFGSCEQLLGYYIDGALDLVGPYGLEGNGGYAVAEGGDAGGWLEGGGESSSDVAASADGAGVQSAAPVVGDDFSGTNNQEAGVRSEERRVGKECLL